VVIPYPGGPQFVNFPDDTTVRAITSAFLDAITLAASALEGLGAVDLSDPNPDPRQYPDTISFLRYFKKEQFCTVQNNFIALLNPQQQGPQDTSTLLTVYFGYRPALPGGVEEVWCRDRPRLMAETVPQASGEAVMLICPLIFGADGEAPRPAVLSQAMQNNCAGIRDYADHNMQAPGSTILHELSHWICRSPESPIEVGADHHGHIIDFNGPYLASYSPQQIPLHGYGPFVSEWRAHCLTMLTVVDFDARQPAA
jgi:hypothetical protein